MNLLPLRTEIKLSASPHSISYQTPALLLGSCFATHIGIRMEALKPPVLVNPFGVLYNPASIGNSLGRLLAKQPFAESELYEHKGIWLSFAHHGSFAHTDRDRCRALVDESFVQAQIALRQAHYLVITLGTAFAYRRKDTGDIVANCHQLPATFFERKLLDIDDITAQWQPLLQGLRDCNPKLRIIFTLSPIRHWKDGAADNQYSKAILTVAIRRLVAQNTQFCDYFPAYELLMDDLRDYRFYETDMLHPNETAIAYIWQKFGQCYLYHPDTQATMAAIQRVNAACQHRPRYPDSPAHRQFMGNMLVEARRLAMQYPHLDWSKELRYFEGVFKSDETK